MAHLGHENPATLIVEADITAYTDPVKCFDRAKSLNVSPAINFTCKPMNVTP